MKVGTKSILFGVHAFWWHPITVAIAWIRLYGFPFDPRIWIAFLVHDLGYLGKPNMDGPEGKKHPETGARIMHLFDKSYSFKIRNLYREHEVWIGEYSHGYSTYRTFSIIYRQETGSHWRNFCLFHSRSYAELQEKIPSKLCHADKLAVMYDPKWFYLLRATASGEIHEYMKNHRLIDKSTWFYKYRQKVAMYVFGN